MAGVCVVHQVRGLTLLDHHDHVSEVVTFTVHDMIHPGSETQLLSLSTQDRDIISYLSKSIKHGTSLTSCLEGSELGSLTSTEIIDGKY